MSRSSLFTVEDAGERVYFEQFLILEARLLDEQKFDEWSDLFVEDGEYWVPAAPDQPDPKNHISLMYETDLLRSIRIKRYSHPNAFSLQPLPRSSHIVTNVLIDSMDVSTNEYDVFSKFIMVQYRNDVQDFYTGTYKHRLIIQDSVCRIVMKQVNLINCDSALNNILLYF